MKLKAFAILTVLSISIFYVWPTIDYFLPKNPTVEIEKLKKHFNSIQEIYNNLNQINLAVGQPAEKRIRIFMNANATFPIDYKIIQEIIGENNFTLEKEEEKTFLVLNENHEKGIFISKIAQKLSELFTTVKKIKTIQFNEAKQQIEFVMSKDKRLSKTSEPIKTMLGDDLDWEYETFVKDGEEVQQYNIKFAINDNIVNLGLDLQGGVYLDVGVQVDEIIKKHLEDFAFDLEDLLFKDSVNFEAVEISKEGNYVELILEPGEEFSFEQKEYQDLLERFSGVQNSQDAFMGFETTESAFEINRTEDIFQIEFTESAIENMKNDAFTRTLESIRNRIDSLGVREPSIQRQGTESIIVQLPGFQDPKKARRIIQRSAVLEFQLVVNGGSVENPTRTQEVLYQDVRDPNTKEVIQKIPYVLEKRVILSGERIADARIGFSQTNEPNVTLTFDGLGEKQFAEITKQNVGRQLAVVLDDKIQTAPSINEAIYGGVAQITGRYSHEEARELASILRSGSLPVSVVIHEERTVGASLGEESIQKSLQALLFGFLAVIIFMVIYYKVAGIFSVFALLFNLVILIGALAGLQASLTLPGMAGIILTIGMAVDANVLIFERIREEIARGNALRKAVYAGFQRATITIFDANVTTFITAFILFQFGTGPIKGFAVTLFIGILASFFTSIVVTRFLFELIYLNRKQLHKLSI